MQHFLSFIFIALTLFGTAFTANCQNKLDAPCRAALAKASPADSLNVIVEFNSPSVDFKDFNIDVISTLANIAVIVATPEQINQISALPDVGRISLGESVKPLNDSATYAAESNTERDLYEKNKPSRCCKHCNCCCSKRTKQNRLRRPHGRRGRKMR